MDHQAIHIYDRARQQEPALTLDTYLYLLETWFIATYRRRSHLERPGAYYFRCLTNLFWPTEQQAEWERRHPAATG